MGDVFISYARKDRALAEKIRSILEASGLPTWMDVRIEPGTHFDATIEHAIRTADMVLVLWTLNSVQSNWVREEASLALELRKLVPVLLDNVEIPIGFRLVHAIDARGSRYGLPQRVALRIVPALLGKRQHSSHVSAERSEKRRWYSLLSHLLPKYHQQSFSNRWTESDEMVGVTLGTCAVLGAVILELFARPDEAWYLGTLVGGSFGIAIGGIVSAVILIFRHLRRQ